SHRCLVGIGLGVIIHVHVIAPVVHVVVANTHLAPTRDTGRGEGGRESGRLMRTPERTAAPAGVHAPSGRVGGSGRAWPPSNAEPGRPTSRRRSALRSVRARVPRPSCRGRRRDPRAPRPASPPDAAGPD